MGQYYVVIFFLLCPWIEAKNWSVVPKWQTVVPDTGIVVPLTATTTTTTDPSSSSSSSSSSASSSWTLRSADGIYIVKNPHLPSDVISNLLDAGIIHDPYYDRNFLKERHVWMGDHVKENDEEIYTNRTRTWIYTTIIELPDLSEDNKNMDVAWKLIVEGIKMGAHISFNGIHLGTTTNQFLRYEFDVFSEHLTQGRRRSSSSKYNSSSIHDESRKLKQQQHLLSVTFDPTIPVDGRFTACTGGWDWAPYTRSFDSQGRRAYSFGIVKPIYLIAVHQYFIRHVVPKIYYRGSYPTRPITSHDPDGPFDIQLDIHLGIVQQRDTPSSPSDSIAALKVILGGKTNVLPIQVTASQEEGMMTTTMSFQSTDVELWWPNGMGQQPLYDLLVGFIDRTKPTIQTEEWTSAVIQRRIAFRTIALVTIDESDNDAFRRALLLGSEGSGSHGMYFRVNGAILFARGANFIPMDQLEGRQRSDAHRIAVKSAADANMNMLRVWGGGMVLPDEFYDACDEFGVLLYHDMMFVDEAGHGPVSTESVELEIRHFVRSLASHPSIVMWNGCNECQVVMDTPSEIYASFVMTTVAEEDDTRSIWPSSPSKHGWKTGVNTLDSRPNGNRLTTWNPNDFDRDLETHGPYMRSYSLDYPGVNGVFGGGMPYENTPPTLSDEPIGIEMVNTFASEFGASVYSSAESMSGTISPEHWSLHGNSPPDRCEHDNGCMFNCSGTNIMAERNYPCDTHIQAYFGNFTSLDTVGERAFQEQTFHCMMAQTLWMKGEIETRRSRNSYGLLIWQLNENWPTGGWGSIEYGPGDKNETQVMGGRWKPLMHLFESSLFRDIMTACGKNDQCYVRNDGDSGKMVDIQIEGWRLGADGPRQSIKMGRLVENNSIYRFQFPPNTTSPCDVFTIQVFDQADGSLLVDNIFLQKHPKDMAGLRVPISINSSVEAVGDLAEVRVTSDNLALFVVLTSRAQGRFSENAFVLRPHEEKTVIFQSMIGIERVDVELLRRTLRIEHLGYYLAQSNNTHDFIQDVVSVETE